MARLTRAELQELNRGKVLAAAREEFAQRGFRDAKIDEIAERAELTRGAVYSNFPGKRALYFAVLAAQPLEPARTSAVATTVREALGTIARSWVSSLPLTYEQLANVRLELDLMPQILAEEHTRHAFAQLMRLDAILLGLSFERLGRTPRRLVRMAAVALTTLHGASQMAAVAPGFVEPFDLVSTCERFADLSLDDGWPLPELQAPVYSVNTTWAPPSAVDLLLGIPVDLSNDGVLVFLGLHRLDAVEHAIRSTRNPITIVLVTDDPHELAPLTRLTLSRLANYLRQAVPATAWPHAHFVLDDTNSLTSAAQLPPAHPTMESAIRITAGHITTRSDGPGSTNLATC